MTVTKMVPKPEDLTKKDPRTMARDQLVDEVQRLRSLVNTPHVEDFLESVRLEAAHQQERWREAGHDVDAGKTPMDWFWLVGFLVQKAATSAMSGDVDKALHHCVSTSAVLCNWHGIIKERRSSRKAPAAEEAKKG